MQTRQVNMQLWSITSPKPFDVVVASVEEAIGRPNMGEFAAKMAAATSFEEMQKVVHRASAISASWSSCGLIMVLSSQEPEWTEIPRASA